MNKNSELIKLAIQIKVAKMSGNLDIDSPDFVKVWVQGFINKFSIILGTLNAVKANKIKDESCIKPDINTVIMLSNELPENAKEIEKMVNKVVSVIQNALSNHTLIDSAIQATNNILNFFKTKWQNVDVAHDKKMYNTQNSSPIQTTNWFSSLNKTIGLF